jgi:hypothetical protein
MVALPPTSPGGSARLAVIEIGADARDPLAAEFDDKPVRGIDRHAAAASTSLDSAEHEHAVAEIVKLGAEYTSSLAFSTYLQGRPAGSGSLRSFSDKEEVPGSSPGPRAPNGPPRDRRGPACRS